MVKLLVFAILLASSPATGLLETLFRTENSCYSGCYSNYAANEVSLDACRKGCNFKLLNEDCAKQCLALSKDSDTQNSCQVGCTLSRPATDEAVVDKPIISVDPVPINKESEIVPPADAEPERPRSIILIRLRQRPSFDMPSVQGIFNNDPIQFFNNIIKQFQEKANGFEESIRKSFEENSKDFPKPAEFPTISELTKNIPIIRVPGNIRADSSSESSEETKDKRPLVDEIKHVFKHPHFLRERVQPINNRVQQFFTDVRTEWNDLVRKQPKIPIWIFLGILLSSSAILWYMVMSLCRHTPSRNALSVRAQELVFHPYEYDAYEKEKIQPDDQPYEVTESLPIKVKLSNI
jgi:hypothetical protein